MDAALSNPITEHARRDPQPRAATHPAPGGAVRGAVVGDVERAITFVTSADLG